MGDAIELDTTMLTGLNTPTAANIPAILDLPEPHLA